MVYHGKIKNGVIVLDSAARLPEGASVRIDVVSNGEPPAKAAPDRNIWDKLLDLAGTAQGLPPDASRQHDHYLYGTPKIDE